MATTTSLDATGVHRDDDDDDVGGGSFLTSLSLEEPALDFQDGDERRDEVDAFLSHQAKRREELAGYVTKVTTTKSGDAVAEEPLVRFPGNFGETVASMVRKSVSKKRDFLKDLRELSERQIVSADKPWETDAKITSGLDKIKKLDDKLKGVEEKLKILAGELSTTKSSSSSGSPNKSSVVSKRKAAFMKDAKLRRVLGPVSGQPGEAGPALEGALKRNAELAHLGTSAGRWFTLSEEDEKLVAEVLGRDDEDEEDPYESVLGAFDENEGADLDGGESQASFKSERLTEIDRMLEEMHGSLPATPSALSLASSQVTTTSSPDSVISPNSKRSYVREAREVRALLRLERDIDAKIANLRQSELVMVPKEEIDLLLQNYYATSASAPQEEDEEEDKGEGDGATGQ